MNANSHRTTRRAIVALAIVAFCAQTTFPAVASEPPPALKNAIAAYNAKQYGQAISQLNAATGAAANSPYKHYYLALSHQALGQFGEAEREYQWNYTRTLDQDLRYKSWQGLQGLASAKHVKASSLASGSSTGSSAATSGSSPTAVASSNSGGVSNSRPNNTSKFILDGSTRKNVANPYDFQWHPGCPRHR